MMGIEIHEEIVENLKNLDSFQLTEVLDFVRFLNYRQKEHMSLLPKIQLWIELYIKASVPSPFALSW